MAITSHMVNTVWVLKGTTSPTFTVTQVLPSAKGIDLIMMKSNNIHPVHYSAADIESGMFVPYKNPND